MVSVDGPELDGLPHTEVALFAFPGEVVAVAPLSGDAAARIAEAVDRELERPWEARVVPTAGSRWIAGARRLRAELVRLGDLPANGLEVAVGPDGDRSVSVDAEAASAGVEPEVDAALRALEGRGRARFEAFVARADTLGGDRWLVTIDPL